MQVTEIVLGLMIGWFLAHVTWFALTRVVPAILVLILYFIDWVTP